jgi:ribosomal-protein-alanine N-acetyltransferase
MLTTKRLILRGPRPEDLNDMFEVYSDPRAMKYWSTPPHPDASVTGDLLNRRINHWGTGPFNFQIEMDGRYIGNAGNFHQTEIGFMLHPDHWRQGIVSEAMGAIIPHLWAVTDHAELTADADPLNAASVGLLTSLGFVETHRAKNTFCINGVWADSVYFKLGRPSPRA